MSLDVTGPQLVAAVRNAAENNPDKAFETPQNGAQSTGCKYFYGNSKPCCIVGKAFHDLGITPRVLETAGGSKRWVSANEVAVHGLSDRGVLDIDPESENWLYQVQSSQDKGKSWSEAVRLADHTDQWEGEEWWV